MNQKEVNTLPDGKYAVKNGLYLIVRGGGMHRSWVLRTTKFGTRYEFGLGSAATLSLKEAIAKSQKYRGWVAAGYDPRTLDIPPTKGAESDNLKPVEQEKVRAESKVQKNKRLNSHLFKDVAIEAIEVCAEVRQWTNPKHKSQWVNTVTKYAIPSLGKKDVKEITYNDILKVLKPIWANKTETATRLRGRLALIFDYAIRKKWRTSDNPARWEGGLEFDLPNPTKLKEIKHHEAPKIEEIQAIASKLFHSSYVTYLCTLFGILTATRCREFCLARWEEIDFESKTWSIPSERRKDKKPYPHRVPLSDWAIRLLKKLNPKESGLIFHRQNAAQVAIVGDAPRQLLQRLIKRRVTIHGCRSTFSDWCAETGKDITLTEKSLMHRTGNRVREAYQRSDLLEQRRQLMQEYADAVMLMVRPSVFEKAGVKRTQN